jgi:formylglycine-generating enzyme required for sulfatase activity
MFRPPLLASFIVASLAVASAQEPPREAALPLGSGVELKLVHIPAGSFQQGSPADEAGRGADETERPVTLTRAFFLGKFPVTRGQFALFAKATNYRTEAEGGTSGGFGWDGTKLVQRRDFTWRNPGFSQTDDDPVVMVTFNDAQKFLAWLSSKTGTACELPTEAQFEYASRAGTTSPFPNADAAWHKGNAGQGTKPVGQQPLNAWGLGDMNGNVWEWCVDWFASYAPGPQTDPVQKASNLSDKPRRVLRGGSWLKDAAACRPAARYRNDPQSRNADNGFRVLAYSLAAPRTAGQAPPPPPVPLERAAEGRDRIVVPGDPATSAVPVPPPHTAPVIKMGIAPFGCACLGFTIVIVLIVLAVRRASRGGGIASSPGNMPPNVALPGLGTPGAGRVFSGPLRTRIVDDGFFIDGEVPRGTVVSCRYVVNGTLQTSEVTIDGTPGGQFVYTGSRPENVSIVVEPGGGPSSGLGGPGLFPPIAPGFTDDDDRRRSRRPPPAY